MSKSILVFALVATLLVGGCGGGEETGEGGNPQAHLERQVERQAAVRRAKMRQQARAAVRRHRRQIAARRHRAQVRAAEAERRATEAEVLARKEAEAEEAAAEEEASECDPNYSGACLDPYAYDYDCEGGSGDGPAYTGMVTVVGEDHYGLDADSDGTGCEPY